MGLGSLRTRGTFVLALGAVLILFCIVTVHNNIAMPRRPIAPQYPREHWILSPSKADGRNQPSLPLVKTNPTPKAQPLNKPRTPTPTPAPTPAPQPLKANTPKPTSTLPVKQGDPEQAVLEQIRRYTNTLPETTEVTVVTAYFNLGPLNKRAAEGSYTPNLYKNWMATFGWLDNPLVVYTDTEETAAYFRQLRARYPPERTTVTVLKRKDLWAFRLEGEIKVIYAQKGYPRHQPNTVYAPYSCAMHAKFELVQKTLREGLHQTRFVAWLDIGLFRAEVKKNQTFRLGVPSDFKRTHVGYSQVNKFVTMTVDNVIRRNMVWVGGASFLATPEVAYVYCSEYRRAVRKLLDMKWMSTDQQVIYSMFQPSFNFTRKFQLQAFRRHLGNSWFSMGYLMRNATITKE